MSLQKINIRNSIIALIIILAAITRLANLGQFSSWSNFSPVGAIALFSGTYFSSRWKAYAMPLMVLVASDWIIHFAYFNKFVLLYDGAAWVYLSFVIMVFIGSRIKKVKAVNVLAAALASVLVHWLLADIQPWLYGSLFPKTAAGYLQYLVTAIPYERNLLTGNLVFCTLMYGGFELAQRKYTVLRTYGQAV